MVQEAWRIKVESEYLTTLLIVLAFHGESQQIINHVRKAFLRSKRKFVRIHDSEKLNFLRTRGFNHGQRALKF